jgi:type I restriction enzyme S subunit
MKLVNLNSVCKILNGYAFKSEEYQRSGAPLIRISNFNDGLVEFDENSIYVDSKFLDSKSEFIVRKGDILIALSGATTGKYGLYLHDFPSLLNQRIGLLKSTQSSQLESKYFYYYLNILKNEILNKAGGAAQPNISTKAIGELQIPLPPIEQQKKIAAILDAADTYRQLTKELIAKYDELTQSLFLDMFGDPVKNEKGWEEKTIEKLVKENKSSIKRGPFGGALKKEIFVEEGYLVYEQFHALNNDFSMARYFIDESKFQELKGFEVKPKDIIISCSGVYLGKLAIIPENARKGIINQALLKITLNEEKMKNNFFVFLFSHKNFREKYFDANRGAGIPNFPPMNEFKKFPFITPPISLQNQFAERVKAIETQKAQAQASLEKAEELFNSLLQKAFKGELV